MACDQPATLIEWLVQQLKQGKSVAIGDAHWHDVIFEQQMAALLSDEVLSHCQVLILEMGASAHQSWLDLYLAGDPSTTERALLTLLFDSLVFPAWFAPHYVDFFQQVRDKNHARMATGKDPLRLILAEPTFDWRSLTSAEDYRTLFRQRDTALYDCLTELWRSGQTAIVFGGAWHVIKMSLNNGAMNVASLAEHAEPGKLVSLWPYMGEAVADFDALSTKPVVINCQTHPFGTRSLSDLVSVARAGFAHQPECPIKDSLDAVFYAGAQQRREDYDFSLWVNVDWAMVDSRLAYMNPRQQALVRRIQSKVQPQ